MRYEYKEVVSTISGKVQEVDHERQHMLAHYGSLGFKVVSVHVFESDRTVWILMQRGE